MSGKQLINFCPAPWISHVVHSSGRITPCCYIQSGNNQVDTLANLKQAFLEDEQSPRCKYCWLNESNQLPSPRLDFLKAGQHKFDYTLLSLPTTTVELLSLNLGNYCNAECISCNGATSSKRNTWAKKYNKKEFVSLTISTTNTQIDLMQYPNLQILTLIGGEPTIHPSTKPLLNQLITNGRAKNIIISINTNASIFDDELKDLLLQFKEIIVTLSIDGAGKYFEYQRRPLKWNEIQQIAKQWMNISNSIVINYVVSVISIWGFNEFVEWFNNLPTILLDKQPQVMFTHINSKQYLTLNVLTDLQKINWNNWAIDHKFKQQIINIINSTTYDQTLIPILAKQIKLEDITSKIKFAELFPDWELND